MTCPAISSSSSLSSHVSSAAHISSSYHCQERSLIQLSSFISFQCFTCSSRRACRWTGMPCRASMELGQALSSTSLVPESPFPSTSDVTWAQSALQGPRSEMEDSIVIRSDGLQGFCYASVLDGHAGFSSVSFLREELFKECVTATQNGALLQTSDLSSIQNLLTKAFLQADKRLLSWLEETGECLESGSTATVMLLGSDCLIVAHVGDSRVECQWGRDVHFTLIDLDFRLGIDVPPQQQFELILQSIWRKLLHLSLSSHWAAPGTYKMIFEEVLACSSMHLSLSGRALVVNEVLFMTAWFSTSCWSLHEVLSCVRCLVRNYGSGESDDSGDTFLELLGILLFCLEWSLVWGG
ncbi:hypothetical protein L7F22_002646 [Adiantum nelumboides]|nr:hypothetical protein [Adiantum nelumboides]